MDQHVVEGDFKNLKVWQVGMELVDDVYRITRGFPAEERFGLASQLQRSAVSIPSNVAEGRGRRTSQEYIRGLMIARGSLAEVETQLLIAVPRDYLSKEHLVFTRIRQCYRLLDGLVEQLKKR